MSLSADQEGTPPRARQRLIWLVVAVPVALVLLSGVYFAIAQPGCASSSCHNADLVNATTASAHADVACASCHVAASINGRLSFGFRQLLHMQLRVVGERGRDWSAVPDARCVACHEAITSGVANANGITIKHGECAAGSQCVDCHSTVAHGASTPWARVYDMETCLECHVSAAEIKCDLCHVGQPVADRITSGVFAKTHGKDWQKTHGMGNASTCTVCHTAATCKKCHGPGLPHDATFLTTHATVAREPGAKCGDCHESSFCSDCHGLEMPHSTTFTRGHAKPAAANKALCTRCHVESDCVTCHVKHVHPGGAIGALSAPLSGSAGGK